MWTEVKNERRHDLLTTYSRTEAEELELQDLQNECSAYQRQAFKPTKSPTYYPIDETWECQRPEAERLNAGLWMLFGK